MPCLLPSSGHRFLSLVANQRGRTHAAPKSGVETGPSRPAGATCGASPQVFFSSATPLAHTSAQIQIVLDLFCMCADNSDSGQPVLLLLQVRQMSVAPRRISTGVLNNSMKESARLSAYWSCTSQASNCGYDRPTVPQPCSPPLSREDGWGGGGGGGLQKLSVRWSRQRISTNWGFWPAITPAMNGRGHVEAGG